MIVSSSGQISPPVSISSCQLTLAGKNGVNLNLLRKEQRKKVPKKRKRERKKISGEYLQAFVRIPPALQIIQVKEYFQLLADLLFTVRFTESVPVALVEVGQVG